MKYNVKASDLGSPEAGRVFWRSATTCLVSFFTLLSASVADHCQKSMRLVGPFVWASIAVLLSLYAQRHCVVS